MSSSIIDVVSRNTMMAFSSPALSEANSFISKLKCRSRLQSSLQLGAVADDVPFCAEACIKDNDVTKNHEKRSWCVRMNHLDHKNKKKLGFDVSSAREWMEHIEQCDGSICGVGAYTVLRCDAIYTKHNKCKWKIWGLDFHLSRLNSSYTMLLGSTNAEPIIHDNNSQAADHFECEGVKLRTGDVITSLLNEAGTSLRVEKKQSKELASVEEEEEQFTKTLMLTILWTPTGPNDFQPTIRGHAAFAGASRSYSSNADSMPLPISACLALPSDPTPDALALLPRRHHYCDTNKEESAPGASAKISSWCRIRRPLEDPTRFKIPGSGVGEVLLVIPDIDDRLQCDFIDSLQLLEGLTSNLFVIYRDGTIRTAPVGTVLSGYARQLIVDELTDVKSAKSLLSELKLLEGMTLDDSQSPTIQDAKDGLWSEVFVTSAIRLVIPVNRILLPSIAGREPVTLWQSSYDEQSVPPLTQTIWNAIRNRGLNLASSPTNIDIWAK